MPTLLNRIVFIATLAAIFVALSAIGQAQLFKSTMVGGPEPTSDVQITTSIMVGLNGFDRHTSIHQIDSNGIKYDLFSRLQNKEIREASGIPAELQTEILLMYESLSNQIHNDTLDAILDESKVKDRFRKIHEEASSLITNEQLERIQIAAAKIDIGEVGLSKFAESRANTLGLQLGETQIQTLIDCREDYEKKLKERANSLRREYNQRWFDSLDGKHRKKLAEFAKSDSFDQWLETKLLSDTERKNQLPLRRPSDLARKICYSKSVRKQHQITAEQLEAVEDARKQHLEKPLAERAQATNAEVQNILDDNQFASLSLESWHKNAERVGTLDEFINGDPANFLELEEAERESLFEKSKQLAKSYRNEQKNLREAAEKELLDAISGVSGDDGERLVQILGLNLVNQ